MKIDKFLFIVLLVLLSQPKLQSQRYIYEGTCDSSLIFTLQYHLDKILCDTIDKYVYDSINYVIIAGKKVYNRRRVSNVLSIDSLVKLIEKEGDVVCITKSYAYLFDFLLSNGLDFDFDYYKLYDRRDKVYSSKYRILHLYFAFHKKYKIFKNIKNPPNEVLGPIIKFGYFRHPDMVYSILSLNPPLDQEIYYLKYNEASSKLFKLKSPSE